MCADIRDGRGAIAPFKGPNTDEQDQLSPGRYIRLATHGRSIQMCQQRKSASILADAPTWSACHLSWGSFPGHFSSAAPHLLDLFQDLNEVVVRRVLQRRELNVGLEFLQPQLLANGQHVRIIQREN